jgi:hypothetical protein
VAACCLVWSTLASAQSTDAPAAEELFLRGREAARVGDYQSACPRFKESYELEPAVGTLLNLAICEQELGQLAMAWQHLRQVRERLSSTDPRVSVTEARLAEVERRLPRVSIRLDQRAVKNTIVERDGLALGPASLGVALPLDPGPHDIVVKAPGRAARRYHFVLAEGEQRELVVAPGEIEHRMSQASAVGARAQGDPPSADTDQPAGTDDKRRNVGIAALIIGGAALAVTAVGAGVVLHSKGVVERECADGECTSKDGVDAAERGKLASLVSTAAFVVGVLASGTGAWLVVTSGPAHESAKINAVPRIGFTAGFRVSY